MNRKRWPNLFIVGAPRAGTTSLYRYLNEIPQIFISLKKEPNFFNPNTVKDSGTLLIQPIRDKSDYLKLFEKSKDEIYLCEATTHYLMDPDSAKLIHNVSPNAKIIITLRDPVEREYSNFKFICHRTKVEKLNYNISFLDEIKNQMRDKNNSLDSSLRLESGLYTHNIKKFLEIFGKENVKILIFENWINDTKNAMNEILQFLKINYNLKNFHEEIKNDSKSFRELRNNTSKYLLQIASKNKILNKVIPQPLKYYIHDNFLTKKEIYPKFDNKSRKMLIDFYHNDVKNLEKFLGYKLPWPNFEKN